jgi:hypothetical protein
MTFLPALATATLLLASTMAFAQAPAVPTTLTVPLAVANPPPQATEPQVLNQSVEDDHVRIEELRVRGQTQRLTVQPKIPGMPAYEIVPPAPGKPPSQDPRSGQRIWLTLPLSF